jgi:hypothetical protein
MTAEQQAYRVMASFREQPNDLARYILLDNLQVNILGNFFYSIILGPRRKTLLPGNCRKYQGAHADCLHADCWRRLQAFRLHLPQTEVSFLQLYETLEF